MTALLIKSAELLDGRVTDIRIRGNLVADIGVLEAAAGEQVIEAGGGLLLPGLHDHHVHIAATAAAMESVPCGPPLDEAGLAARLGAPGTGWLRGIGYHESVTGGLIGREWLDRAAPHRPVRVQHRTGRMWLLNSVALELLKATDLPLPPGLDEQAGHLFDDDGWMRRALGGTPPDFTPVGAEYARLGVTGVTEMSPGNGPAEAGIFFRQHADGALPQRVLLAGTLGLGESFPVGGPVLGPVKLHLHEAALPDFDEAVALMRAAHGQGRVVAVHCVTVTELVFTLAALREAGVMKGDRIEHASVTPEELLAEMAALGLAVVVQPNFVAERGDEYMADIPAPDWPDLYRLRSFRAAGITMAGGSDTPFGRLDPWAAMAAAVARKTRSGVVLGAAETLTPEEALGLFLADPVELGRTRRVEVGTVADLCLLRCPWAEGRGRLEAGLVRATFIDGRLVYDGVDKAPV